MARRRAQIPRPKIVNGGYKIWFRQDVMQADGTLVRVQRTKVLGRVKTMTMREAQKAALKLVADINDCEPHTVHEGKTVGDLVDSWTQSVGPNKKRSTRECYAWAFKRILPAFGAMRACDVEPLHVQRFVTDASRELAPESVRDLFNRVRGLFRLAVDWGWIAKNPAAAGISLPESVEHQPRIMEAGEFLRLLERLQQPYRAIVALCGFAGLRRGEVAALRWNDFQPGLVTVDEAVYRGVLSSPKTKRSRRQVQLVPLVESLVDEWRGQAPFTKPDDFAFSIRTNAPITLNQARWRHLQPACRELGIPVVSWHDLRHCFTTWCRDAGVEAEELAPQLGHRDARLLQRVYSHLGRLKERPSVAQRLGAHLLPAGNDKPSKAAA